MLHSPANPLRNPCLNLKNQQFQSQLPNPHWKTGKIQATATTTWTNTMRRNNKKRSGARSAGKRIAKRSEKWIGTMYTIRKNQTAMKSTRKAMKSFGRWRIGIYGYMGGGGGAAARVATRIWVCGEEWASRLHPALAGVSM